MLKIKLKTEWRKEGWRDSFDAKAREKGTGGERNRRQRAGTPAKRKAPGAGGAGVDHFRTQTAAVKKT